jgi:hypothetical protein
MHRDRAVELFHAVAAHHGEAWAPSGSPKFGANALRVSGKIYAALTRKHHLLLKLPPVRVKELLAAKRATRFESGGRVMNGWITLACDDEAEWVTLSDEARTFVAAETKRKKR